MAHRPQAQDRSVASRDAVGMPLLSMTQFALTTAIVVLAASSIRLAKQPELLRCDGLCELAMAAPCFTAGLAALWLVALRVPQRFRRATFVRTAVTAVAALGIAECAWMLWRLW